LFPQGLVVATIGIALFVALRHEPLIDVARDDAEEKEDAERESAPLVRGGGGDTGASVFAQPINETVR
jgi:hypothetical protein